MLVPNGPDLFSEVESKFSLSCLMEEFGQSSVLDAVDIPC
jgi:hypothetical protein